jgi:hypothetical protein
MYVYVYLYVCVCIYICVYVYICVSWYRLSNAMLSRRLLVDDSAVPEVDRLRN